VFPERGHLLIGIISHGHNGTLDLPWRPVD